MLNACRSKKGYYVRKVKEGLWTTFGRRNIQPFADSYTKDQMKAWKARANVRKVYEDLYSPTDPNNAESDTYLAVIIRSVFGKECSASDALWTQAVLESIFDTEYLSSKIEGEIIEKWTESLSRNDSSSRVTIVLFVLRLFVCFTLFYLFLFVERRVESL